MSLAEFVEENGGTTAVAKRLGASVQSVSMLKKQKSIRPDRFNRLLGAGFTATELVRAVYGADVIELIKEGK